MKALESALKQIINNPVAISEGRQTVTGVLPTGQTISVTYSLHIDSSTCLPHVLFRIMLGSTVVYGHTQMKGGLSDEETAKLIRMHYTAQKAVDSIENRRSNENKNIFQEWANKDINNEYMPK